MHFIMLYFTDKIGTGFINSMSSLAVYFSFFSLPWCVAVVMLLAGSGT